MEEYDHRIVALDPGGTTGWATFSWRQEEDEIAAHAWNVGQISGTHHDKLDAFLGELYLPEYRIVCETFQQYRELDSAKLMSVEYIGVVRRFAQNRGVTVYWQSSSMGKISKTSFVKPPNIRRLGLWSSGQRHAMDALSHLLCYMINYGGTTLEFRTKLLKDGWQ